MRKMKHPTGSKAPSAMYSGSGPAGAGQVCTGGPGKAAMRVTPRPAGGKFQGGANSYKPRGMKIQRSGE